MAFFLTKTVFIHTPKCAGRWIKGHLNAACTVLEKEYTQGFLGEKNTEHYAPTLEEIGDKKPFAFVRHPIVWLASLHNHRMRKRGNWFRDRFPLERAGHSDWHQFVKNVCDHQDWIQEYFDMHVGPYGDNIAIGKMEDVEGELIRILTDLGEPFDISKLKGKGKVMHKRSNIVNTMERANALSTKEKEMLYDTQKTAFLKYGYSLNF
jgi:hypothetical protein